MTCACGSTPGYRTVDVGCPQHWPTPPTPDVAVPPPATSERTSPWTRDVLSQGVCSCGHLESNHRIDLKRMACTAYGADTACPCRDLDTVALQYREHRYVTVPLP